jgi:hypothetical protein
MAETLQDEPKVGSLPTELTEELKGIEEGVLSDTAIKSELGASEVHLPPKLAKLLTTEDIRRNANNYPEMKYDLPEALVDSIRERLLQLPLVHRTDAARFSENPGAVTSLYGEPVPHSYLVSEKENVERHGNTFQLDRDLDLDEFVFLSWGEVFSGYVGGSYALLVSPELLFSPDCLVTPDDISGAVSSKELRKGVGKLDDKSRAEIEKEYLGKIVSGRDWLEIVARRIAQMIVDGVPEEEAYSARSGLGEIKYRGRIPRSMILAHLDLEDNAQYPQYRDHIKEKTHFILEKPKGRLAKLIGKIL